MLCFYFWKVSIKEFVILGVGWTDTDGYQNLSEELNMCSTQNILRHWTLLSFNACSLCLMCHLQRLFRWIFFFPWVFCGCNFSFLQLLKGRSQNKFLIFATKKPHLLLKAIGSKCVSGHISQGEEGRKKGQLWGWKIILKHWEIASTWRSRWLKNMNVIFNYFDDNLFCSILGES